jgi:alkylation response protein AidB-like acyl-CoA dehydrogenase
VTVPYKFHVAWQKFKEGGWLGLSVPEEYGGQGLPYTLASAINEFVSSSNMAFSLYPGLTRGNIQALLEVATEAQKQHFIPKMASGEWTGTMNLTEPHCGTDLGLIKTKATPALLEDEFYITGQKIFISCGEHDLADNIIHLVLARIEGDPEGTKGISLFVVPKLWREKQNNVSCGSIEHKMGIHGATTCVMNYDGAVGYLVGERCKGLNAMFIMMNEARLGVAVQGLSQSELAYQNAVAYAKDRKQGSKITEPNGETVSIIEHPDVRRMLMDIRCVNEAGRLLVLESATLIDRIAELKKKIAELKS